MSIPEIEYLIILLAAGAAWLLPKFRQGTLSPIGELVERIMHNRNTRIAVIAVWWWLGWHFFTA
ncbi:MAG: hypothetical protein RL670_276 [Actinomycetota bacterium]